MSPRINDEFVDQTAPSQEVQEPRRFFSPGSFEGIQYNRFDNSQVKRIPAPCVKGKASGNQVLPVAAKFEYLRVTLREKAGAVGAPEQDEAQQKRVRDDRYDNGLQHKCGWP